MNIIILVSKLVKLKITLLVFIGSIGNSFCQELKLPELNINELIKCSEDDIGYWGDGYVYVIDLWGTWCKPCIEGVPKLTAISKKYSSQGLRLIGYSWEDPLKVERVVSKLGSDMDYILVNDSHEKFIKTIAEEMELVEGFPFAFVISEQGYVIWKGNPKSGLDEFLINYFKM